jgi:hypothetical protein
MPENSAKTATLVPTGRRFQPGQSGNPGGRPRVVGELRDLARRHVVVALDTLIEVMEDRSASPSARVAAANSVLDRGFGRPAQLLVRSEGERDLEELTDAELRAFIVREYQELSSSLQQDNARPRYLECPTRRAPSAPPKVDLP